jgi:hypothetical protein
LTETRRVAFLPATSTAPALPSQPPPPSVGVWVAPHGLRGRARHKQTADALRHPRVWQALYRYLVEAGRAGGREGGPGPGRRQVTMEEGTCLFACLLPGSSPHFFEAKLLEPTGPSLPPSLLPSSPSPGPSHAPPAPPLELLDFTMDVCLEQEEGEGREEKGEEGHVWEDVIVGRLRSASSPARAAAFASALQPPPSDRGCGAKGGKGAGGEGVEGGIDKQCTAAKEERAARASPPAAPDPYVAAPLARPGPLYCADPRAIPPNPTSPSPSPTHDCSPPPSPRRMPCPLPRSFPPSPSFSASPLCQDGPHYPDREAVSCLTLESNLPSASYSSFLHALPPIASPAPPSTWRCTQLGATPAAGSGPRQGESDELGEVHDSCEDAPESRETAPGFRTERAIGEIGGKGGEEGGEYGEEEERKEGPGIEALLRAQQQHIERLQRKVEALEVRLSKVQESGGVEGDQRDSGQEASWKEDFGAREAPLPAQSEVSPAPPPDSGCHPSEAGSQEPIKDSKMERRPLDPLHEGQCEHAPGGEGERLQSREGGEGKSVKRGGQGREEEIVPPLASGNAAGPGVFRKGDAPVEENAVLLSGTPATDAGTEAAGHASVPDRLANAAVRLFPRMVVPSIIFTPQGRAGAATLSGVTGDGPSGPKGIGEEEEEEEEDYDLESPSVLLIEQRYLGSQGAYT